MSTDVTFCPKCGEKNEQPKNEQPTAQPVQETDVVALPQKKAIKPLWLAAIGGGAFLLLIIIIVVVFSGSGGGAFDVQSGGFHIVEDGNTTIFIDSRGRTIEVDSGVRTSAVSMDATRLAALTVQNDLYFVDNGRAQRVAEGVVNFVISNNGSAIAFVDDNARLVIWETRNGRSRTVESDVISYSIALSPDGRSVGFAVFSDRTEELEGFISINGRNAESIGRNALPIAISDRGRFVYYVREDRDLLFVRHRGESTRVAPIDEIRELMFNRDFTEVLWSDREATFISARGQSSERVVRSSGLVPLLPVNTQLVISGAAPVLGVRTFANMIFYDNSNDAIIFVDRNFEARNLARGVVRAERAVISADGRTVVFLDDRGRLRRMTNMSRNEPTIVDLGADLDIVNFITCTDADHIYFVDRFDELWFIRGTREPSRVRTDVGPWSIVMSPNSNMLFFIANMARDGSGELFTTTNGRSPNRVDGANDVLGVIADAAGVYYHAPATGNRVDVFRSNGNARFTRIAQDVTPRSLWW